MRKTLIFLFSTSFAATLLITAPATLLDSLAQHYSQQKLQLTNASGTLWAGEATPTLISREQQQIALPRLNWEIQFSGLLQGKLPIRLQWQNNNQAMWLQLYPNRVEIQQLQLQLPARLLSEISPMLKPIQLRGQLALSSPQLELQANNIQGQATLLWQNASSRLSPVAPLGNYQLQLQGQGPQLQIQLSTLSGALQLNGSGSWQAGKPPSFSGTAQASPEYEESLRELLNNLGPRLSPGVHRISLM